MSPSSAPAPVSPNPPTPTTDMDLKFLPDDPIRNADQDQFKLHGSYAKALKKIVMGCPTPFVVGLSGPWGSGKTTVVEMLKQELHEREQSAFWLPEHGRVPVVILDVSQFSDDSLRRWILFEIQDQLREQKIKGFKPFKDKSGRTLQDNLERTIQEDSRHPVWQHILCLAGWFAVGALAWWGLGYVPHLASKRKDIAAVIAGAGLWDRFGALLRNGQSYVIDFLFARRTITTAPTFSPEQFHRLFRKMVSDATSNHSQRLVLCFDNLDRATGKVAVEVLQTIKAFLNEDKCVCVLPFDEDAMLRHLTAVYSEECQDSGGNYSREDAARLASEYLQKYFNAVLRLPAIHRDDIRSYTDLLLKEIELDLDDNTRTVIASAYGGETPRQVKRFLNDLIALILLTDQLPLANGNPLRERNNLAVLAKLLAIRSRWHSHFEKLFQEPAIARKWNQAAATGGKITADATDTEEDLLDKHFDDFLRNTHKTEIPVDIKYYWYLKASVGKRDVLYRDILDSIRSDNYPKFRSYIEDASTGPSALSVTREILADLKRDAETEAATVLLRHLLRLLRDNVEIDVRDDAESLACWLLGPPDPFKELGHFNNEARELGKLIANAQVDRKQLLSNWVVARFQELPLAEVARETLADIAMQTSVLSAPQQEAVGRILAKSLRDHGEERLSALDIVKDTEQGARLWPMAISPVVDGLFDFVPNAGASLESTAHVLWQLMPRVQCDERKLRFAMLLDDALKRGERSEIGAWIAPLHSSTTTVPTFSLGARATKYLVERFPIHLGRGQTDQVAHTIAMMVELVPFIDKFGVDAVDTALESKIKSVPDVHDPSSLVRRTLVARSDQVILFLPRTAALLQLDNTSTSGQ